MFNALLASSFTSDIVEDAGADELLFTEVEQEYFARFLDTVSLDPVLAPIIPPAELSHQNSLQQHHQITQHEQQHGHQDAVTEAVRSPMRYGIPAIETRTFLPQPVRSHNAINFPQQREDSLLPLPPQTTSLSIQIPSSFQPPSASALNSTALRSLSSTGIIPQSSKPAQFGSSLYHQIQYQHHREQFEKQFSPTTTPVFTVGGAIQPPAPTDFDDAVRRRASLPFDANQMRADVGDGIVVGESSPPSNDRLTRKRKSEVYGADPDAAAINVSGGTTASPSTPVAQTLKSKPRKTSRASTTSSSAMSYEPVAVRRSPLTPPIVRAVPQGSAVSYEPFVLRPQPVAVSAPPPTYPTLQPRPHQPPQPPPAQHQTSSQLKSEKPPRQQQPQQQSQQPKPRRTELLTEEEKRINHIQSEQKRRDTIRTNFAALAATIPTCNPTSSKAAVLAAAADFIRELEDGVRRFEAELQGLEDELLRKRREMGFVGAGLGEGGLLVSGRVGDSSVARNSAERRPVGGIERPGGGGGGVGVFEPVARFDSGGGGGVAETGGYGR